MLWQKYGFHYHRQFVDYKMNIIRKLKKIHKRLREVAFELAFVASPREKKGDYVVIKYKSSNFRISKLKSPFFAQLITDPIKPRDLWRDIWSARLRAESIPIPHRGHKNKFVGFVGIWNGKKWEIRDNENEIWEEKPPKNWNPR